MKSKERLVIILLMVATIALPAVAHSFTLTGLDWTWQNDPQEDVFFVNPNCSDSTAGSPEIQIFSIIKGADAWTNEGGAKFEFRYGGITDKVGGAWAPDGYNIIFFSSQDGGDVIATTYYHTNGDSLIEWDMKYWDGGWVFWGGIGQPEPPADFDIWDIAAHEFGHCLGLDHWWQWQATMFASANFRETRSRDLWDDDIAGIQSIYGVPDVKVTFTPDDSMTVVPAGGGSFGYSVQIKNNTGTLKTRTLWIDVTLPNGNVYGPIEGPVTVNVPAGATWDLTGFVQEVPSFAPAGVYCYNLKSSTSYGGNIESMTTFPFIKESTSVGASEGSDISDWRTRGFEQLPGI